MTEAIRWAILGTGSIAHKFATGLQSLPHARLQAVGSRREERAEEFGEEFQVPECCGSYEALVRRSDVDVVYVATPHAFHKANTLMCLEAGKAVLCEKPFAVNAREAREMIRCARENGVFCMEGMWTRFFPLMDRVRDILREGLIGDIRLLEVDFGFRAEWDPRGRLFDPELAGGSLLDVGVYCCSLAHMVFGRPRDLTGFADLGETGVDEQAAWVFRYPGGELAICFSAVRTNTPQEAILNGTEGRIRIHSPWWSPTSMTVDVEGQETERMEFPLEGNGMNYEAAAVMDCLRQGKMEHPVMRLEESLEIVRIMDELRAQWQLKYPLE